MPGVKQIAQLRSLPGYLLGDAAAEGSSAVIRSLDAITARVLRLTVHCAMLANACCAVIRGQRNCKLVQTTQSPTESAAFLWTHVVSDLRALSRLIGLPDNIQAASILAHACFVRLAVTL